MAWGISPFLPCLPPRCGSSEVSLGPLLFHCLSCLCCRWVASLTLRTFIPLCADDCTFPSPAEVPLSSSGPAHPTTIGHLHFLVTRCLTPSPPQTVARLPSKDGPCLREGRHNYPDAQTRSLVTLTSEQQH